MWVPRFHQEGAPEHQLRYVEQKLQDLEDLQLMLEIPCGNDLLLVRAVLGVQLFVDDEPEPLHQGLP
jgi:hypothetical protein